MNVAARFLSALLFTSLCFGQAVNEAKVDGIWLGALDVGGGQKLHVQIHVDKSNVDSGSGRRVITLDSLDQGAMGISCINVQVDGPKLSFEVPAVKGSWTGTLSTDGNELKGVWSQGGTDLPLSMTRQAVAAGPSKIAPKYEDARAPVTLDHLKEVLDADLAAELKSGDLSPQSAGGVVVGVVQHGKRLILAYGPVKEDSIFEIGSITKTFTGLILAQMVEQKKVTMDEPLRDLLPAGTVAKPASGAEITLLDLATQHSGLPPLPSNFAPKNSVDPYADYSAQDLYAFLAKQGVAKPDRADFVYSNLGFGTLGQALANKSGLSYADLLKQEVTGPLKLTDTVLNLSPGQQKRFTPGHYPSHQMAPPWTFDALAGCGAIRSTASDMLTYLEVQLHPETTKSKDPTMEDAIETTHELLESALPGMNIGLAWLYIPKINSYWHNGATGGYNSYALFSPSEDYALIVLYNTTITQAGGFADRLGEHLAERLSGRPALILQ
jgi:CubicO group peptidase (beta-lactamase class C family)